MTTTTTNLQGRRVTVHDMTLRDGMHPKRHRMTLEQMKHIATGLDEAGVPLIEVTHGDGLGGSSVNYGFPAHSDEEYLGAVIPLMKKAKVSALLIPGIGTVDHLRMAHGLGVHTVRVATHCTEADVSEQHIAMARRLGMDTVGFLMMAHMASPEMLVSQALLMEGYGANCIYVTDSAGYMLPDDVDVFGIQDVAEDRVVPIMDHMIRIDRDSLTLGYAGVYSSFLLFAKRAEKKYGVPAREILVELGRRGMVGGQEDMIEDTAITLAREKEAEQNAQPAQASTAMNAAQEVTA